MQRLSFVQRGVIGAVAIVSLLGAGAAQATLQDRDLDGNGQTDAFYDTDLDITWLRDADMNGSMQWSDAVSWAASLSFAGYADWRLPKSDGCLDFTGCTGSEMGHLWYVELGNTAGAITNSGDFLNLRSGLGGGFNPPQRYWSGTTVPGYDWSEVFVMGNGTQEQYPQSSYLFAMAVRDGDVPAIPEPGTYALMLVGLAGLTLWRRAATPG